MSISSYQELMSKAVSAASKPMGQAEALAVIARTMLAREIR